MPLMSMPYVNMSQTSPCLLGEVPLHGRCLKLHEFAGRAACMCDCPFFLVLPSSQLARTKSQTSSMGTSSRALQDCEGRHAQ